MQLYNCEVTPNLCLSILSSDVLAPNVPKQQLRTWNCNLPICSILVLLTPRPGSPSKLSLLLRPNRLFFWKPRRLMHFPNSYIIVVNSLYNNIFAVPCRAVLDFLLTVCQRWIKKKTNENRRNEIGERRTKALSSMFGRFFFSSYSSAVVGPQMRRIPPRLQAFKASKWKDEKQWTRNKLA